MLKDVLEEFLLELEIRNYSKRTLKSYKNNNRLFFTYLEKEFEITEIKEVKVIHVKNYLKFLKSKGRKESYINGIIKCFRAYFKYAIEEDYISINPMLKVGWIREGKTLINSFTDEEVHKMMKLYLGSEFRNIRNKCIMAILFDTGIRNLELCKLKNKYIKEMTIVVKNGKGNKQRVVSISPYLKKIILRYVRCRDSYY